MAQPGYDFSELCKEAHNRWLKPAEVLFILQNYEEDQLTHELAKTPPTSGSLFLYNKRVLRFFRRDGHSWRKKKDGKTVGEAHERLKAGNIEALNCYYAHGEQNPNFQRRSYWMLDQAYDNIVLVHYRDITEGWQSSGSSSQFSSGTSVTLGQSSSSYQYPGSSGTINGLYESNQSLSSPPSVEIASDAEMKSIRLERSLGIRRISPISSSSDLEVNEALHRLKEQLSLNDETLEEIDPLYYDTQDSLDVEHAWKDHSESSITVNGANDFLMLQNSVNNAQHHHHDFAPELTPDYKDSLCWKEMLDFAKCSVDVNSQDNNLLTSIENENELLPTRSLVEKEADQWINLERSTSYINSDITNCHSQTTLQYAVSGQTTSCFDNNPVLPTSTFLSHEVQNFNLPAYSSIDTVVNYNEVFNQGQSGIHLEADQFSISDKQKFTIREVSPEWGYAYETTKVVIIGSFLCDPSECVWTCMFGDIEVPVQVIQTGVICCLAPPLPSHGNVSLSVTCGDKKSCSEVRDFEYRSKGSSFSNCSSSEEASSKSLEELLFLVRLVHMLLSEGVPLSDSGEAGSDLLRKLKVGQDSWDHVMEAVFDGSWTSSSTIDWLLQELLKDKLQQWLSPRSGGCEQFESSLSKKEQGILHLVAGLDYEWALNPILNSGVNIDFRDIAGWTALHWAARFGREKMVAALVAKGASAGAVTDPSVQDPNGKTPATIASLNGHKGLAGYLSEIALTSHLSCLTLEEDDNSICSAEVEAEIRVNHISQRSLTAVDQHSLAAVWNASQAATRIQAAFRAHSFRQRQQRGAASSSGIIDEYGIFSGDIEGLSAASKLAFGNARNHNTAALSIQKKYRGWKGRKNYLSLRRKVVKIQAHVRGHQVRAQYKVFCWAVGIMEKVVLRWRRRGCGLRGYKPDLESIVENEAEEDILKVFRKKKVDDTVKDAFKRVLSMVEHPEARQQYHRVLAKHQEAMEAELEREFEDPESEINMTIVNDNDDDDLYQYIM